MNNIFLLAWLDDWQMSARLAKLSSAYSYELVFCENGLQLQDSAAQSVLIIDIDSIEEEEFQKVDHFKDDDSVFIKKTKPNFKTIGPKYGKNMKAIASLKRGLGED